MKITEFLKHNYRHFNAAALIDAAEGYKTHLDEGGKMMVTLAGAMSTAELGISLAEMIRQDKVQIISCTGANLEEDVFNLVAHDYYERVPNYRELTPEQEQGLLERHMNRVTDTCIPEMEAMRRIENVILEEWVKADQSGHLMNFSTKYCFQANWMLLSKLTLKIAGYWKRQRRNYRSLSQVGRILPWVICLLVT